MAIKASNTLMRAETSIMRWPRDRITHWRFTALERMARSRCPIGVLSAPLTSYHGDYGNSLGLSDMHRHLFQSFGAPPVV